MKVNGQLHALAAFFPGEWGFGIHSERAVGGPNCRYRCCVEENRSLASVRNRTTAVNPVAIQTELSRLHTPYEGG
jgi:hypothetical protein